MDLRHAARAIAAAVAVAFASAPAEAQIRLKAGHILPATSDQGMASEFFAKRVKELSNGAIDVQVFHAGELGKSMPAQLENVVSGAQDFLIDTFDYFKAWDARFGVVNTPFVFRDRASLPELPQEPALRRDGRELWRSAASCSSAKSNYNWLRASDRWRARRARPVFVPDDLKGMKAAHVPGRGADQGVGRARRQRPGDPVARHLHSARPPARSTA